MLRKFASYTLENVVLPGMSYHAEKVFDRAMYSGKGKLLSLVSTPVWLDNRHLLGAREFFTTNCQEVTIPFLTPLLQIVSAYTVISPEQSTRFNRSGCAQISLAPVPVHKGKDSRAAMIINDADSSDVSLDGLTLVRYKNGYILISKDMIGPLRHHIDSYSNTTCDKIYLIGVSVDELAEDMLKFQNSKQVCKVDKVYFNRYCVLEHVAPSAREYGMYEVTTPEDPEAVNRPAGRAIAINRKPSAMKDAWSEARAISASNTNAVFRTREGMEYAIKNGVRVLGVNVEDIHFPSMDEGGFKGAFYPPQIMDIVEDIRLLLSKADWYSAKGVAINMGILVHGPAGTGKSTLAGCIGKEFGIPVHLIHLNSQSDSSFISAWDSANSDIGCPRVILLEDIDNIFNKREPIHDTCTLSFDTLLNKISGVSSMENVILIITTNRIDYVDPAIGQEVLTVTGETTVSRPGRIERIVHLGTMDVNCRTSLIEMMLEEDYAHDVRSLVDRSEGMTCAQVKDLCTKYCTQKLKEELRRGSS